MALKLKIETVTPVDSDLVAVTGIVYDSLTRERMATRAFSYKLSALKADHANAGARRQKIKDDLMAWATTVRLGQAGINELSQLAGTDADIP